MMNDNECVMQRYVHWGRGGVGASFSFIMFEIAKKLIKIGHAAKGLATEPSVAFLLS